MSSTWRILVGVSLAAACLGACGPSSAGGTSSTNGSAPPSTTSVQGKPAASTENNAANEQSRKQVASCPDMEKSGELRAESPAVQAAVMLVLARAELTDLASQWGPKHPTIIAQNTCIEILILLQAKTQATGADDVQRTLNVVTSYHTLATTNLATLKQSFGPAHPSIHAAEARIQVFAAALGTLRESARESSKE